MAKVVEGKNLAERLLDYQQHRWQELEEKDRLWDELTEDDKFDFLTEWSIVEDKLSSLEEMVKENKLTSDQVDRFTKLQERIARDRPILESLWERP